MNFLTKSLAFVGIASFAATANADCTTDFDSDAFQGFLTTMGVYYDDDATVEIPALCLAAGGDIFAFSGTTTCGDQVDDHFNDPMCLPTSCTSNEAVIALMIPMIIYQEESCIGSYTYDGLGDGTPDSLSCQFDLMENYDTVIEFNGLYINEMLKMFSEDCIPYLLDPNAGPIPEECQPDYTGMQPLCQDNDMDYFTMSFTETCDDGSSEPLDVQDIPQCFSSSCTSDEAALKAILADMTGGESDTDSGPVCTNTDYSFSGLGEVEEEEENTTSPPSEAPDEQEGKTTSGSSFRASIAGSVLMLAVASVLL
jgi:hypothetical protein